MNNRLRHGILATVLGVLGVTLSVLGFFAARSPVAAQLVTASGGVASLLTGLAFTACAVAIVLHYGRHSAQLASAYNELHRVTLQRERSEAALRESERFTRATLDAMDARIAVLDADGVVMAVNRAWHAPEHPLIGDGQLCDVGSHYLALCESISGARTAEGQRVADGIREVMSGARIDCTVEDRIPGVRDLLVTRITRFAGRGPLRLVVAHQMVAAVELAVPVPDLAAVRRAEDALTLERAFLRDVMDLDRNPIFAKDRAGRFMLANQAMAALYGTTVQDLIGKTDAELVADEALVAAVRRTDLEVLDTGAEPAVFDEQVLDREGNARWFETVKRAVLSPDGHADLIVGVCVDVTERKRIERELHASEEALQTLAESNAALVERVENRARERDRVVEEGRRTADELRDLYDTAPCGYHSLDERGVVVSINQTALAWLGYQAEEIVGTRFVELLAAASQPRFDAILPELERSGSVADLELDVLRKDGSILPVSMSLMPVLDADGRVVRRRCTMFDITARRHAEEQVGVLHQVLATRACELEKANQELEAFSYAVSRDLRTPLGAIDGFARILHDENGDQLDAGGRRHLGVIRENASRMMQEIDALLDLSRLGRLPLDRSRVDMTALARTVADEIGTAHQDRDVAVVVDGLAPAVGDVTLLRQLFANLIGNAFKYTSKIDHPCVDVGSVEAEGAPIYYVRDNGAGFDMRYADKLFRVFERLHSPSEFDGTGIGLAVVQRIVDRHGGRVWAEGRVGDGATFFFTLDHEPDVETSAPVE